MSSSAAGVLCHSERSNGLKLHPAKTHVGISVKKDAPTQHV
jgi:hypothetical protein